MMQKNTSVEVRDLIDFYQQWPSLKDNLKEIEDAKEVGMSAKETLKWLIKLADKVGTADIK